MIKNKILDIRIIFKTYLKQLKTGKFFFLSFQINFCSIKYQRTNFQNCFQKLFFKTIFENSYQIYLNFF